MRTLVLVVVWLAAKQFGTFTLTSSDWAFIIAITIACGILDIIDAAAKYDRVGKVK